MVEIEAEDCRIVLGDGATPRYYDDLEKVPKKNQLYIEFDDSSALVCTLFGNIGGYQTLLSKKTVWTPCVKCGYELHRENYMGGTILLRKLPEIRQESVMHSGYWRRLGL